MAILETSVNEQASFLIFMVYKLVRDVSEHHRRTALFVLDDVRRHNVVEFENLIAHFTLSWSDQSEGGLTSHCPIRKCL
jgi:hypothetical protein